MKRSILQLIILVSAFVIYSCSSKTSDTESESQAFDDAQEEADVSSGIEGLITNLPSPAEIPWLLESTGVDFNEDVTNPYNKVDKYKTTFDVASLNMGIYAADLGYLSAYNKTQDAINYLTSMKGLSEHLGVSSAWDLELMNRFESNLVKETPFMSFWKRV